MLRIQEGRGTPMGSEQRILELGLEGGGATIFRAPTLTGWSFHVEGGSMDLDESDTDYWRAWTRGPVESFEAAIRLISDDGQWVIYHPIYVHLEYRETVWQLAQQHAKFLPKHHRRLWKESQRNWSEACSNW